MHMLAEIRNLTQCMCARSWPVSWTGTALGLVGHFDSTRIVNVAGLGSSVGSWSVCMQLLHSGWAPTSYTGYVALEFKDIAATVVSSPVSAARRKCPHD
jgi:hypothetical protein